MPPSILLITSFSFIVSPLGSSSHILFLPGCNSTYRLALSVSWPLVLPHSFRLTYGVPIGLILEPIIFNLYTTPLSSLISLRSLNHHHYADDTQLFFFHAKIFYYCCHSASRQSETYHPGLPQIYSL